MSTMAYFFQWSVQEKKLNKRKQRGWTYTWQLKLSLSKLPPPPPFFFFNTYYHYNSVSPSNESAKPNTFIPQIWHLCSAQTWVIARLYSFGKGPHPWNQSFHNHKLSLWSWLCSQEATAKLVKVKGTKDTNSFIFSLVTVWEIKVYVFIVISREEIRVTEVVAAFIKLIIYVCMYVWVGVSK